MLNFQIKINIQRDKEVFAKFLLDQEYLEKRGHVSKKVFQVYPELYQKLSSQNLTTDQKKEITENFVENLYTQEQEKIETKLEQREKLFNKNAESISEGFRQTMNYEIQNETIYIYPSFLPSSTFGKDYVCFSLLKKNPPYLDLFLHEYSHIIWNKQVEEIYQKTGRLDKISHDYLKEIVAPVIIRDKIWDNIRQAEFHKYGNTRQQLLNIEVDGKIYNLIDYFQRIYQENKSKGRSFRDINSEYVGIFHRISEQINQKHQIYNSLQNPEDKEELEDKGFLEPMIL